MLIQHHMQRSLQRTSFFLQRLFPNPSMMSNAITSALVLLTLSSVTFWLLQILQIQSPVVHQQNERGVTILHSENTASSHVLFGEKPFINQKILLRGLVITSSSVGDIHDGYAIFEIDGKSTKAIAIGEMVGSDLVLNSIQTDSATLTQHGKRIEIPLSKKQAAPPK
jgi:hypothetical protein